MKPYREMPQEEIEQELAEQRQQLKRYIERGLNLNLTRGKPSAEQLDLSMPLLDLLPSQGSADAMHAGSADDLRNYGNLTGLPEARELMGAIMGVPADNVIIGGNSSLNLMYDTVSMSMTHGVSGSKPWALLDEQPVFLCPVPGYDRHFSVTEHFGIKMIPVPLSQTGPDMDIVEELVDSDPLIKGIWCVPRFSNPSGCVYSDETVRRFASLAPAAEDFRIYWDNAYAVHDLVGWDACDEAGADSAGGKDSDPAACAGLAAGAAVGSAAGNDSGSDAGTNASQLLNIKDACEAASNPDIWYQFASTSKITFAGSGLSAMASSTENIKAITRKLGFQTIGPDKLNQKRHALFLPDINAVHKHMARHAAILKPKFDLVAHALAEGLTEADIGTWTDPKGGYFVSFDGLPGTAKRTVELAGEAGVVLTEAGAPYPYGNDPLDANLRLAPTYPGLEELKSAMEVFVVCARIAALEQLQKSC